MTTEILAYIALGAVAFGVFVACAAALTSACVHTLEARDDASDSDRKRGGGKW